MPDQTTLPAGATGGFKSALDSQVPTSFGGTTIAKLTFPVSYHELEGEQRDHVHEYPHTDGGAPEKLGRRLYTLSVRGYFHDNFPQFPDLYPYIIDQLQLAFEQGTTDTFTHPSIGEFPAYIKKWHRRRDPQQRSGEIVDMVFVEDQQSKFLQAAIADASHFATLGTEASKLAAQLAVVRANNALTGPTLSLFDAIQTLANDISAVSDTAQLYGNLVSAKAQQLANICAQVDGASDVQDSSAYPVIDALHNVWLQAQVIVADSQAQRAPLQEYIVPTTMPLTAVSERLFGGDASQADQLLALNTAIVDPLNVTAGSKVLYYPAA